MEITGLGRGSDERCRCFLSAGDGAHLDVQLDVQLDAETVWLTQKQMADCSTRTSKPSASTNGTLHGRRVGRSISYPEIPDNCRRQQTYDTAHYNLDVSISVGYRVKSRQGARFRQWATGVPRQHIVPGYTVNEQCSAALTPIAVPFGSGFRLGQLAMP